MEIGTLIKEKRVEKNMTMKDLADLMDVSEGTISRWESGDIKNIKRKKIIKLSEVLDISIYTIMGWPEPSSKSQLCQEEQQLLDRYNMLDQEDQKQVIDFIDYKLSNEKYTKLFQKREA